MKSICCNNSSHATLFPLMVPLEIKSFQSEISHPVRKDSIAATHHILVAANRYPCTWQRVAASSWKRLDTIAPSGIPLSQSETPNSDCPCVMVEPWQRLKGERNRALTLIKGNSAESKSSPKPVFAHSCSVCLCVFVHVCTCVSVCLLVCMPHHVCLFLWVYVCVYVYICPCFCLCH